MSSSGQPKQSGKVDFKQLGTAKKIESPLAAYNSAGQLTCIICNQVVKSELVWNAHVNSKTHLDNKNKLKSKLKGEETPPAAVASSTSTSNGGGAATSTTANKKSEDVFKLPAVPPPSSDKEMLKRLIAEAEANENDRTGETASQQAKKQKIDNLVRAADSIDLNRNQSKEVNEKMETTPTDSDVDGGGDDGGSLPKGFFDDPDEEARVRGGPTRSQQLDAEYEEFKRLMQSEQVKSDEIIERDDTVRDIDRDLVECDELITRWTRIEQLHQKRDEIKASSNSSSSGASVKKKEKDKLEVDENDNDEDEDEVDLDTVMGLALRAKNIC